MCERMEIENLEKGKKNLFGLKPNLANPTGPSPSPPLLSSPLAWPSSSRPLSPHPAWAGASLALLFFQARSLACHAMCCCGPCFCPSRR